MEDWDKRTPESYTHHMHTKARRGAKEESQRGSALRTLFHVIFRFFSD